MSVTDSTPAGGTPLDDGTRAGDGVTRSQALRRAGQATAVVLAGGWQPPPSPATSAPATRNRRGSSWVPLVAIVAGDVPRFFAAARVFVDADEAGLFALDGGWV